MSDIELTKSNGGYVAAGVVLVHQNDFGDRRVLPILLSQSIGAAVLESELERGHVAALLPVEINITAEQIQQALSALPAAGRTSKKRK